VGLETSKKKKEKNSKISRLEGGGKKNRKGGDSLQLIEGSGKQNEGGRFQAKFLGVKEKETHWN